MSLHRGTVNQLAGYTESVFGAQWNGSNRNRQIVQHEHHHPSQPLPSTTYHHPQSPPQCIDNHRHHITNLNHHNHVPPTTVTTHNHDQYAPPTTITSHNHHHYEPPTTFTTSPPTITTTMHHQLHSPHYLPQSPPYAPPITFTKSPPTITTTNHNHLPQSPLLCTTSNIHHITSHNYHH